MAPLAVVSLLVLADLADVRNHAEAALTFTNLDDIPPPVSLADGFKVSLVRPPDEAPNSGTKMIVNHASIHLLEDEERQVLDSYDALFEKYSLFCNGRWLGAQVLQDSQDLLYMQHIVYMKKPDIIIETGTYKGGLTYFFASLLDWIDREKPGDNNRNTKILSVDRHHPDMVYAANWFCPVCIDCIRPYKTEVWERKVRFIQGLADSDDTHNEILSHLYDLGYIHLAQQAGDDENVEMNARQDGSTDSPVGGPSTSGAITMDPSKTVVVNLDANHEFEGLMKELIFYAPLVSANSYLVVQDAKLDAIWGTAGPTAALNRFLSLCPPGEFVVEPELKFHAYSQHIYVRRAQVTVGPAYFFERFNAAEQKATLDKEQQRSILAAAAGES